ncbi:hypothetical protein [Streptomyces sp. NPDC056323]|uniref:hypothetical protein n=1 Tax=unclassified Streptomyces TaxID=2593676 RepID=UPI0035E22F5F
MTSLLLSVPASAGEVPSASGVEWSSEFETAVAAGQRWTEEGGSALTGDLVIAGTLSSSGDNCYSVWTRFVFDFAPGPIRKQAQICGPGSAEVNARQAYQPTATGYLTVCKGTEDRHQPVRSVGEHHVVAHQPELTSPTSIEPLQYPTNEYEVHSCRRPCGSAMVCSLPPVPSAFS